MATNELIRNRKLNKDLSEKLDPKKSEASSSSENSSDKNEHNLLVNFQREFPNLLANRSSYYLTRIILLRFLAFIYGISYN